VTAHGTGAAAAQLKHPLGGKTGTTSDFTDAWFLGFSPSVTCGVWVGYDSRQSLGEKETGAKAALPIWIDFMRAAIAGKDTEEFLSDPPPDDQRLKAAMELPAKPDTIRAAEIHAATMKPPAAAIAGAVKTTGIAGQIAPAPIAAPRAKAFAQSVVTPVAVPSQGATPSKSQVKPAMVPQPTPAAGTAAVKPAAYAPRN
jgi:penicillin-binding protein 1A